MDSDTDELFGESCHLCKSFQLLLAVLALRNSRSLFFALIIPLARSLVIRANAGQLGLGLEVFL